MITSKFETTASGIDITGHTETDTLNFWCFHIPSNVHLLDDDKIVGGSAGLTMVLRFIMIVITVIL